MQLKIGKEGKTEGGREVGRRKEGKCSGITEKYAERNKRQKKSDAEKSEQPGSLMYGEVLL